MINTSRRVTGVRTPRTRRCRKRPSKPLNASQDLSMVAQSGKLSPCPCPPLQRACSDSGCSCYALSPPGRAVVPGSRRTGPHCRTWGSRHAFLLMFPAGQGLSSGSCFPTPADSTICPLVDCRKPGLKPYSGAQFSNLMWWFEWLSPNRSVHPAPLPGRELYLVKGS